MGRCSLGSCAVGLALVIAACASKPEGPSKYPARAEGCDVTVYPEAPVAQIDNIGTVHAVCAEGMAEEECLRELKDQACKLGADVVWGVPSKARINQAGKLELSGRAAHTKVAAASDAGA